MGKIFANHKELTSKTCKALNSIGTKYLIKEWVKCWLLRRQKVGDCGWRPIQTKC
jgi:hypothetical protein